MSKSSEISEVFYDEVAQYDYAREIDPGETQNVGIVRLSDFQQEQHHVFPNEFDNSEKSRDFFESFGFDVDQYVIDLDRGHHQETVHGNDLNRRQHQELPHWNDEWREIFQKMEEDDGLLDFKDVQLKIIEEAQRMIEKENLSDFEVHHYNRMESDFADSGLQTIGEVLESMREEIANSRSDAFESEIMTSTEGEAGEAILADTDVSRGEVDNDVATDFQEPWDVGEESVKEQHEEARLELGEEQDQVESWVLGEPTQEDVDSSAEYSDTERDVDSVSEADSASDSGGSDGDGD